MAGKNILVGLIVLVLIIIGIALFLNKPSTNYITSTIQSTQSQGNPVAIQLTDPPQVPAGTQALVIAYSSEQVHLSNAGNQSGWVSASGSSSIDLLSVINLSQTIGTVSIPANASINMVRFNVTSATIKINGTTYNVIVPSQKVTAHIIGVTSINPSSSILIDLEPTIAAIITDNSTVYVMVPSLKAVIVGNASNTTTLSFGARVRLTAGAHAALMHTTPNVTITNASIRVAPGNVTHISITVKDNSNSSFDIQHAGIFGNISVKLNGSAVNAYTNKLISNITERIANSKCCGVVVSSNGTGCAGFELFNSSVCSPSGLANLNHTLTQKILNLSSKVELQLSQSRLIVFGISGNSSLMVPQSTGQYENSGYVIRSGQSVTLHFDGVIETQRGIIVSKLIAGNVYKIGIQGTNGLTGAKAVTNVTAASSGS